MVGKAWEIIGNVCEIKRTEVKEVIGWGRGQSLVSTRRKAIRQIREFTNLSLTEIGKIFGGRDHSTILHYLKCEGWVK